MAFADPQSITIGGTATTLPRTFFEGAEGKFTAADGNVQLRVSHLYGKRTRRLLRIDSKKVSADPLNPNINVPSSMSVQLVVDTPVQGFTVAEQQALVAALAAYLSGTPGAANITKLLGGEA